MSQISSEIQGNVFSKINVKEMSDLISALNTSKELTT